MSEQRESFMQALDAWMDVNVIAPLVCSEDESNVELTDETIAQVKKAISSKVLDSFHNGRRAAASAIAGTGNKPAQRPTVAVRR